jgi:hypothetical protein
MTLGGLEIFGRYPRKQFYYSYDESQTGNPRQPDAPGIGTYLDCKLAPLGEQLQAATITQQRYDKEKEEAIAFFFSFEETGKNPNPTAAFLGHHTHGSSQIMLGEGVQYLHEHDITPQNPRAGLVCRIINKTLDERILGRLVKHRDPSGATERQRRRAEAKGS